VNGIVVPDTSTLEQRVSSLETKVANIDALLVNYDPNAITTLSGKVTTLEGQVGDLTAQVAGLSTDITSLNTKSSDHEARIAVLEAAAGITPLNSPTITGTTTLEKAVVTGDFKVGGHATFAGDTVGKAKIIAGDTQVRIKYDQTYATQPVVTVTPQAFDGQYKVVQVDKTGFTIQLSAGADTADIVFNWHAFGSNGSVITNSDGTTTPL
jgi:hypothetical protein